MYTLNAGGGSTASQRTLSQEYLSAVANPIFGQLAAGQAGQQLSVLELRVLVMDSLNLDFNGTCIK
ncbi:MAG: hypothetical protein F4X14_06605 [Caldilineaceae bacterium SB0661_bin_32]|uniref:Uncharacterized protein n=1 Tax=Caldilineaceae bacterium SB0661_bin_32 TaxID=2605255 RepID=A0A6B1D4Z3_9CHLR|nr:hypothetical protein [Caldilineaceae bacterium SB0661_bin_32]